jgi:hypothetical protein
MGIREIFERVTGLDKIKAKAAEDAAKALEIAREAEEAAKEAERIRAEAEEASRLATLSPKERATERGEPWVAVLDTKVNPDNPRNGFFELDWNEHFIVQLRNAGYGEEGDPDEEIVDRWFRDLAYNMLVEADVPEPERVGAGFINVTKLANGKAQVE